MAQANLQWELSPDELAEIVGERFRSVSPCVSLALYDASGNLVGYHKAVVTCEVPDGLPDTPAELLACQINPKWRTES